MLLYLGLLLPTCFIPGITGALIPTQWAVLSAVLPLGLWHSSYFGPCHWLGLLSLAWAAFSLQWTPSIFDGIYGLWIISIWALAFWLGGLNFVKLQLLWQGLALGLTVSSVVAIFQALGYRPVEVSNDQLAGLLFNSTVLGASCALVIIACAKYRLWLYIPGLLPALYLSHSRAAWAVLGLTFLAGRIHILVALCALVLGNLALVYWLNPSDTQRLLLWGVAIHELSWLGHGIGSFGDFYYLNTNPNLYVHSEGLFRTEFVHNDYIQLWFELGIGAIPIYAIIAFALCQTTVPAWPIFFAFATFGLFYFPLYSPITAFIGLFSAGSIIRDWYRVQRRLNDSRPLSLPWYSPTRLLSYRLRPEPVPLAPPT